MNRKLLGQDAQLDEANIQTDVNMPRSQASASYAVDDPDGSIGDLDGGIFIPNDFSGGMVVVNDVKGGMVVPNDVTGSGRKLTGSGAGNEAQSRL